MSSQGDVAVKDSEHCKQGMDSLIFFYIVAFAILLGLFIFYMLRSSPTQSASPCIAITDPQPRCNHTSTPIQKPIADHALIESRPLQRPVIKVIQVNTKDLLQRRLRLIEEQQRLQYISSSAVPPADQIQLFNQEVIVAQEPLATSIQRIVISEGWSMRQSVHDQGVVRCANRAVAQAQSDNSFKVALNDLRGTTQSMIDSIVLDDRVTSRRSIASATLDKIFTADANTPYGMKEKDLLKLAVQCVLKKNTDDMKQYLVDQLADGKGMCAHGRATRLADVIALAQDVPIIPEALIQKQMLDKLQELYTADPNHLDRVRDSFNTFLKEQQQSNLITASQATEYLAWVDAL